MEQVGWRGRWVAPEWPSWAVLVGQEEEAEIWLLLHRKAGKPPGHGQWDFKAAKAVRMLRPPCSDLKQVHRESLTTLLGSTSQGPSFKYCVVDTLPSQLAEYCQQCLPRGPGFVWTRKRVPGRQRRAGEV